MGSAFLQGAQSALFVDQPYAQKTTSSDPRRAQYMSCSGMAWDHTPLNAHVKPTIRARMVASYRRHIREEFRGNTRVEKVSARLRPPQRVSSAHACCSYVPSPMQSCTRAVKWHFIVMLLYASVDPQRRFLSLQRKSGTQQKFISNTLPSRVAPG